MPVFTFREFNIDDISKDLGIPPADIRIIVDPEAGKTTVDVAVALSAGQEALLRKFFSDKGMIENPKPAGRPAESHRAASVFSGWWGRIHHT